MNYQITWSGVPTDDEATAAVTAVMCILEEEAAAAASEEQAETVGWQEAARLTVQGLEPARLPVAPTWGHIERLRRAGRGGTGIVGQ
jgi:hypothetical protein